MSDLHDLMCALEPQIQALRSIGPIVPTARQCRAWIIATSGGNVFQLAGELSRRQQLWIYNDLLAGKELDIVHHHVPALYTSHGRKRIPFVHEPGRAYVADRLDTVMSRGVGGGDSPLRDGRHVILTFLTLDELICVAKTCRAWYATACQPMRRNDLAFFNAHVPCMESRPPPRLGRHVTSMVLRHDQYSTTCGGYGIGFPSLTALHTNLWLKDFSCMDRWDKHPAFPPALASLSIRLMNRTPANIWKLLDGLMVVIANLGASLRVLEFTTATLDVTFVMPTPECITQLTQLETLKVWSHVRHRLDCGQLCLIRALGTLTHLTELSMPFRWTVVQLQALCSDATVPPMRRLSMRIERVADYQRDTILALHPFAATLTTLNACASIIPTSLCDAMQPFTQLTELKVCNNTPNVSVSQLLTSLSLHHLRILLLEDFRADDTDIETIGLRCPNLIQLGFGVGWTSTAIKRLAMTHLVRLRMFGEKNTEWCPDTDCHPSVFPRMPNLKIVDLWSALL